MVTLMSSAPPNEPTALARLRLWQLISPASPVGAYAYSAGLESAIEHGWVATEDSLREWMGGLMTHGLARLDVPILLRFMGAWQRGDTAALQYWSRYLQAVRETAELAEEDRHLGGALARLLHGLDVPGAAVWRERSDVNYPSMFALAAVHWQIGADEAAHGFLWAWCENQVTAAMKLMPLGQTVGQRLLNDIASDIGPAVSAASQLSDQDVGQQLLGMALASALHETQYSRLFRS